MKTHPDFNEVSLTQSIAKVLRPFLSDTHRTALQHLYITKDVLVASDGQSIVERQVQAHERGTVSRGWEPKLLPREYLTLLRKVSEWMTVNLLDGSVEIMGNGPIYPIRLPPVSSKTQDGQEYPAYHKVFDASSFKEVATLGINPKLVARAMAVRQTHSPLVLRIPPNTGKLDHIVTGVPFEIPNDGIRGLLMPMRIAP